MQKEILVAVDGSVYSDEALSYLAGLFSKQPDINFHLCSWVTAAASIMPSSADPKDSLLPETSGRDKKGETGKRYLTKAREKLIRYGIDSDRIQTSVEVSGYNIAATIQQKAENDLSDAILVGRRGLNGISEMLMGSVSANLFRKCHSTPLWIIDGEVHSKNFLVPLDGSLHSLMAIDHLAHILSDREDIRIFLFHCSALFGKKVECRPEDFYHKWEKEWCDAHLSGTGCLFEGPLTLLKEAGIPARQIHILPEAADLEEAHGIIREAKREDCGTIVMGRRGSGMAKGLFGGVSARTIKRAQNIALWIIG
ncbi:MAG: universal stress protein [Proteobacteria bacterium]|nr:universal stress protein [Pseudomonadota bacterium]MBU1420007.1 universal stress protein [Pseudomonadota bacterium]MBU1454790.1 universal stress protein [Pseudomonadota bacterium]